MELVAIIFVIGGGLAGLSAAIEENIWLAIVFIPLGLLGGFIMATITLCIPILILQMNNNIAEINSKLD